MSITTHIDETLGLRTHTASGELTFTHLREVLEDVYSDPELVQRMNVLWDLRDATPRITAEEVNKLAEFVGSGWGASSKNRAAIVVSRDFGFGMARMYELLLSNKTSNSIMVFRDLDEAKTWLSDSQASAG